MQSGSYLILSGIVPRLPVLLVCILGAVLALATMRKHATISLLTLAAMSIMLLWQAVGTVYPWIIQLTISHFDASEHVSWFYIGFSILGAIAQTSALALLLWAVFAQRTTTFVNVVSAEGKPE